LRVLSCDSQASQLSLQEEDDYRKGEEAQVKRDVDYLIKCLGVERNTSYRIIQRPDIENRQSAQPDFLVEDCTTGSLIAIEHARFFESEKAWKCVASLVKKLDSQSDTGAGLILPIHSPTPEELGKRLSDFVLKKLNKGQFKDYSHTERILLARNRWSDARIHRFKEAGPCFKLPEPVDCDHFYLIVRGKLLEVF